MYEFPLAKRAGVPVSSSTRVHRSRNLYTYMVEKRPSREKERERERKRSRTPDPLPRSRVIRCISSRPLPPSLLYSSLSLSRSRVFHATRLSYSSPVVHDPSSYVSRECSTSCFEIHINRYIVHRSFRNVYLPLYIFDGRNETSRWFSIESKHALSNSEGGILYFESLFE